MQCCLSRIWTTLTRLWTVGQHCLHCVRNCFVQCWPKQTKTTFRRLFSSKNILSAQGQYCTSNFLVQYCLRRTWTTLTRQYSYASNVVPVWSIQHCIGYFLHKSCLLDMSQHYNGKNLVQCCQRCSRQQCTGKSSVQCCLNTLGTTLDRSKPYTMLSLKLLTTMHRKKSCSMMS